MRGRLARGRLGRAGRLFAQNHASLRDGLPRVSRAELDLAWDGSGTGALSARMTGGGFGGSAIALVPSGPGRRGG